MTKAESSPSAPASPVGHGVDRASANIRRVYRVNVIGRLRPEPAVPTALTVATYGPGASALKNAARFTLMSPDASGVGLPRSDVATGAAVFGSAPLLKISSR